MTDNMLGILVWAFFWFIAKRMDKKGIDALSNEQKGILQAYYMKTAKVTIPLTLLFLAALFILAKRFGDLNFLPFVFVGFMLLNSISRYIHQKKTLAPQNFPNIFFNQNLRSAIINLVGLVGFIITILMF